MKEQKNTNNKEAAEKVKKEPEEAKEDEEEIRPQNTLHKTKKTIRFILSLILY